MSRVIYADGQPGPRSAPSTVLGAAGVEGPARVVLGWTIDPPAWLHELAEPALTYMAGFGLTGPIAAGRVRAFPVRLGSISTLLAEQPPEVAVVVGVPRAGGGFSFGRSVGWADVLARVAERVVVEVDRSQPDLGGPSIDGNVVATIERPTTTGRPPDPRPLDEVDRTIGELVVSLLPPDPTVQFGVGGVADAVAAAIDRPVRLWSGLLTDNAASLADRVGFTAPVTASYTWGGEPIERLNADGLLDLVSCRVTHDVGRLAAIDRLVTCNGALEVGLDGSVNLERVGGRVLAGIGGHADFCEGATKSIGGLSIVATRSTTSKGASAIVPEVEVVSTPRSDVGVVVTEHGIADLRGLDGPDRARRLIEIAAPEHRATLRSVVV